MQYESKSHLHIEAGVEFSIWPILSGEFWHISPLRIILATQQPLESALGNPAGSSELFNKHRLTRFVPLLTFLVMRFTFNLTA